ncbi:MAG TPA: glycerophosphodiester phosphodiesterase [Streptosporangiaceae bacterium]|nr:glycerophosphodiester phosphodiesterase [Streptosporangiaceae bacterium]
MTAISAHRAGESEEAYEAAAAVGADYVEIDVRRTGDGELVAHHDDRVRGLRLAGASYRELCVAAGRAVPRLRDVLAAIAGRAAVQLDLKEAGCERAAVAMATGHLDPADIVVTSRLPASVALVKREFTGVRTALSLGRGWYEPGGVRDLFPLRRLRACGADWIAINHRLAGLGVLGRCAQYGFPAMVWTVNTDALMRQFLADPRVAVLITDRPHRAAELRHAL